LDLKEKFKRRFSFEFRAEDEKLAALNFPEHRISLRKKGSLKKNRKLPSKIGLFEKKIFTEIVSST